MSDVEAIIRGFEIDHKGTTEVPVGRKASVHAEVSSFLWLEATKSIRWEKRSVGIKELDRQSENQSIPAWSKCEQGSSSSRSGESVQMANANLTRCFMPLEKSRKGRSNASIGRGIASNEASGRI